jgi:DNA-binding transcriptional LysR family regulator
MNWGAVDLNLLIVFDAVMQERNVTRAGGKIGLSQPAVSHALSRLRHMLKDELFIRTPDGMMPTPRAEQLAAPLRRALSDMQLALEPETFVPQEATRLFVLALNNYAAVILAPSLVTAVNSTAPGIRLDLRPTGMRDMPALLDRGEFDLAIGTFEDAGERFAAAPLLEDSFVVVMGRDHPAAQGELTEERARRPVVSRDLIERRRFELCRSVARHARSGPEHHAPRSAPLRRRHPLQHQYGGGAQPPPRRALGADTRPFDLQASLCIARYPHQDALASPVR